MKIQKCFLLFCIIVFNIGNVTAQPDTIMVYTVNSQMIDTIFPISFNPNIIFENTASSIGLLGNQVALSISPPTSNLFSNSNFSDLANASEFYDVTSYPIRTGVKLIRYKNGSDIGNCSGIMVGPDFVLTSSHCAYNFAAQTFLFDSMLIAPAFNNGAIQSSLPASFVQKTYIFKSFYDSKHYDDIALLQLNETIGEQIGWIGMAYSNDTSYFNAKVFHKLSYPAVTSPFDSTLHYNGDTLYYNYGYINNLPNNNLGILSSQALAIPGQSGSSIFYTDNIDYYSFGVLSFSNAYNHFKITPEIYYQLKNILSNYSNTTGEQSKRMEYLSVFPNPFQNTVTINLSEPPKNAEIELINLFGQVVKTISNINTKTIIMQRDNLSSGLYIIQIKESDKIWGLKKVMITE